MTPESLAALAEKVGAMTPGEWEAKEAMTGIDAEEMGLPEDGWYVPHDGLIRDGDGSYYWKKPDAEGIAALRNNADELLRLARRGMELEAAARGSERASTTSARSP